jgi:hypothetical protein
MQTIDLISNIIKNIFSQTAVLLSAFIISVNADNGMTICMKVAPCIITNVAQQTIGTAADDLPQTTVMAGNRIRDGTRSPPLENCSVKERDTSKQ